MQDARKSKTEGKERPAASPLKFSCCNFENMAEMMRKFWVGEDGSFDCCAMMQKMCSAHQEKSDQEYRK